MDYSGKIRHFKECVNSNSIFQPISNFKKKKKFHTELFTEQVSFLLFVKPSALDLLVQGITGHKKSHGGIR